MAKIYFGSQFAPLIIFFVMFLSVVKNTKLHHFVRFNCMQVGACCCCCCRGRRRRCCCGTVGRPSRVARHAGRCAAALLLRTMLCGCTGCRFTLAGG